MTGLHTKSTASLCQHKVADKFRTYLFANHVAVTLNTSPFAPLYALLSKLIGVSFVLVFFGSTTFWRFFPRLPFPFVFDEHPMKMKTFGTLFCASSPPFCFCLCFRYRTSLRDFVSIPILGLFFFFVFVFFLLTWCSKPPPSIAIFSRGRSSFATTKLFPYATVFSLSLVSPHQPPFVLLHPLLSLRSIQPLVLFFFLTVCPFPLSSCPLASPLCSPLLS